MRALRRRVSVFVDLCARAARRAAVSPDAVELESCQTCLPVRASLVYLAWASERASRTARHSLMHRCGLGRGKL